MNTALANEPKPGWSLWSAAAWGLVLSGILLVARWQIFGLDLTGLRGELGLGGPAPWRGWDTALDALLVLALIPARGPMVFLTVAAIRNLWSARRRQAVLVLLTLFLIGGILRLETLRL